MFINYQLTNNFGLYKSLLGTSAKFYMQNNTNYDDENNLIDESQQCTVLYNNTNNIKDEKSNNTPNQINTIHTINIITDDIDLDNVTIEQSYFLIHNKIYIIKAINHISDTVINFDCKMITQKNINKRNLI